MGCLVVVDFLQGVAAVQSCVSRHPVNFMRRVLFAYITSCLDTAMLGACYYCVAVAAHTQQVMSGRLAVSSPTDCLPARRFESSL